MQVWRCAKRADALDTLAAGALHRGGGAHLVEARRLAAQAPPSGGVPGLFVAWTTLVADAVALPPVRWARWFGARPMVRSRGEHTRDGSTGVAHRLAFLLGVWQGILGADATRIAAGGFACVCCPRV